MTSHRMLPYYLPMKRKAPENNPYDPFIDLDGNGMIIITPMDQKEFAPSELVFMNISRQFQGLELRDAEDHPDKHVKYDFNNTMDAALSAESLQRVIDNIEKLYRNEIDVLGLWNLPGVTYETLAGQTLPEDLGAVQWDRKDFDKLIGLIRMFYDKTITRT